MDFSGSEDKTKQEAAIVGAEIGDWPKNDGRIEDNIHLILITRIGLCRN